jgi:glycosyltransferase involved in cell wall biosynthesis
MTSNGRRLRVLQIGKYFAPSHGGIESHLRDLCSELRKSVDLKVIVANHGLRRDRETVDGIDVIRLGRLMTLASAPICPAMINAIRREHADIVHLHLPNPAAAIACLLARPAGALVITWHSDVVRQRRLVRLYQPLERMLLKRCAAIVAASPAYIAGSPVLREHADRCRLIPYGIDAGQFAEDRVDHSLVEKLRQRFGPRIILAVGRLVYYKGIKFLIQAMAKVDARLVIIGEGPLRAELERQAAINGISDRVIFLGQVDHNLTSYYHASDVLALPSCERSEAFGIVQLEAMACGKPVVNTQIDSGVPYASLDGVTGFTVEPRSSDAMAAALNRLLDNPDLRRRMGRAARDRVVNEFGIREMAARTLDLYSSVLSEDISNVMRDEALPVRTDHPKAAIEGDGLPQPRLASGD